MTRRHTRLLSKLVAVPVSCGLVLAMGVAFAPPAAAQPAGDGAAAGAEPEAAEPLPASDTGLYVVQLAQPSLATYTGGIPGLAATSPRVTGAERLDAQAPASQAYLDHLAATQDAFETRMERELDRPVEVAFEYRNVLNGMAVAVDATEAARLAALPGVAAVYADEERELTTDVSHDVIGSAGFWDGETGPGLATRGEGVVVGMIDTGVNGDHPSFATVDGDGYVHTNPLGSGSYLGVCDPSHPEHEDICTDKLIGAYNLHPDSPSASDWNDHGSHVGSTIAGNRHEATFTVGQDTYTRTIQGVAPRANVVSFLVCFPQCPSTSSVAAVEQAIADGVVDVLNFSISGSDDPWNDPVDLAFLEAYEAGIYVSASAGNDGPGASTVAKTGPWNASVAATTHQRVIGHIVELIAPTPAPPELAAGVPAFPGDGPQVSADIEGEVGFVAENPTGCDPFPAGAFTGLIALIQRGGCTFAVKVENATDAGAVAVLVANNVAGPPTAPGGLEEAQVPTAMIEQPAGAALQEVVLGPEPALVRINVETDLFLNPEWEDIMAGFSSRGPSQFDVLAPTFAAPGVNILAAGRELESGPENYAIIGGTSMSSPHGAGAAALLVALHPGWSPAQVRSALAGTADPDALLKEDGVTPADPFDQGSGRLDLAAAARVGLVLDESAEDFAAADPATGGDPRTLNVPHLVDGNCVPSCTWTRTLTGVADADASYTVATSAPAGMTVEVSPSTVTVPAGGTATIEVTATANGLAAGQWVFADIRLETTDQHAGGAPIASVHYPVVVSVQPPELTLEPEEITSAQPPDEVVTQTLTIGNAGGEPLSWELAEGATDVNIAQAGAPVTVWDQPVNGTSGIISDFYSSIDTGVYAADDFAVPGEVALDLIHADGFINTGDLATDATALNWYIYPDAGGVPAGHPEDGQDAHVWTFSTPPDGEGVTIVDNSVTLDVVAATGDAIPLTTGTYWLTVFPDLASPCCAAETRWNWQQGTPRLSQAHLVDPSDLFGSGLTDWTPFGELGVSFTNTAFRLEGTVDCTPGDIPWLEAEPESGTVAAGERDEVTITLDSTGLDPGVHQGSLCLSTNDPSRELTVIPVTLQVEQPAEVPAIEVTPAQLSAELTAGQVAEETLTIGNVGDGTLEWSVVTAESGGDAAADPATGLAGAPEAGLSVGDSLARGMAAIGAGVLAAGGAALEAAADEASAGEASTGEASAEQAAAAQTTEQTTLAVLWDQPASGTNGIVSDYFTALGGGVYAADELALAGPTSVELIHAEGFQNQGDLTEASAITWFLYPDAGGVPAGHPEDGQDAHVWTYSSTPAGAGIEITDDNVTLDVVAATGGAIPLTAGTYWLVVYPDISAPSVGGDTRWNWYEAVQQGAEAHLIDPTDLFGAGLSSWTPFSTLGLPFTGTAFRVEGSEGLLGCVPGEVPWLDAAPESGTTPAGGTSEVTVTLDATGLAAGEYTASVCVLSNDPANPVVEVPVALTVQEEVPTGCDQTITGTHAAPLTVTEGVTCLAAGAQVLGPISVLPGGGLVAGAAVVQGPVFASGATVVEVAFSQVTGPVLVSRATGPVTLFGNQITGSVLLTGNTTGDTPATVSGNTVIGSLSCAGNRPPPTDHGLPNTVVGAKTGQCAEL